VSFVERVFRAGGDEIEKKLKKLGGCRVLSSAEVPAPGAKILRLLSGPAPCMPETLSP